MLSARKNMDVVDAYARLGSDRAAGEVCGVDPKTVKLEVLAHEAGLLDDERAGRAPVPKDTDGVRGVVAGLVREAGGGHREAAAATGAGGRVWRVGPQLSAARGVGEASGAW